MRFFVLLFDRVLSIAFWLCIIGLVWLALQVTGFTSFRIPTDSMMPNSSRCVGRDKDFIVYMYRPEEFYEKKDELGDKAMTLLNEVKEDDNPILVLYN